LEKKILLFIVGSEPVSVGKPGKQKKKLPYIASGAMIDDWHTCVKNLNVSSRENQAHRLVDGSLPTINI
jgi:E3 ubiquitin-protein ligase HERC2